MFCSCAPLPEVLRCSPRGKVSFLAKGASGSVIEPGLKVKALPSPTGQNCDSTVPLPLNNSSRRLGEPAASARRLEAGTNGARATLAAAALSRSLRRRYIIGLLVSRLRKRPVTEPAALGQAQ